MELLQVLKILPAEFLEYSSYNILLLLGKSHQFLIVFLYFISYVQMRMFLPSQRKCVFTFDNS